METSYDAILFDFDGVLIDSEPVHYECWLAILEPFGISVDWRTYCDRFIGCSDRSMLLTLCEEAGNPSLYERIWAEYPRKRAMFRERMSRPDAIPPASVTLLAALKPSYRLAVVTSSAQGEVEPMLERSGILPLLDAAIYGGDVARLKPHPDPYLLAAERLSARRPLVVEDSRYGVQSAQAAGFDYVQISRQPELAAAVLSAVSRRS